MWFDPADTRSLWSRQRFLQYPHIFFVLFYFEVCDCILWSCWHTIIVISTEVFTVSTNFFCFSLVVEQMMVVVFSFVLNWDRDGNTFSHHIFSGNCKWVSNCNFWEPVEWFVFSFIWCIKLLWSFLHVKEVCASLLQSESLILESFLIAISTLSLTFEGALLVFLSLFFNSLTCFLLVWFSVFTSLHALLLSLQLSNITFVLWLLFVYNFLLSSIFLHTCFLNSVFGSGTAICTDSLGPAI